MTIAHFNCRRIALAALAIAALTLPAPAQEFMEDGLVQPETEAALDFHNTFSFSQKRPRLVVLIHGITSEKQQAPAEKITTSSHARYYWGFEFIKGLSGFPAEDYARVITPRRDGTMRFRTTHRSSWSETKHTPEATNELAPILYPMSWLSGTLNIDTNTAEIKNYIRLMTKPGTTPVAPVMVTYRDGSKHLMPQASASINQIYDTYQAAFGHLPMDAQPQIYLVGHSFGGIIARTILANPSAPDLFGNRLAGTDRIKADFIRSRVAHVTTVSTPHHGTPVVDAAGDIAAFIRAAGGQLTSVAATLDSVMKVPPFSTLGIQLDLVKKVRDGMMKALNKVAGERDCLKDIARMSEYNAGILAPATARRSLNGSMVPIYTLNGRDPGGRFYDRSRAPFPVGIEWLPYSVLDLFFGDRFQFDAFMLHAIEGLMHEFGYGKLGKKPFGNSVSLDADRITKPYKGVGPTYARPVSAGINLKDAARVGNILWRALQGQPYLNGTDGENDSDGFVGFDSGHAWNLTGSNWYRVFSKTNYGAWLPWDNDNHGTIVFNPAMGSWIHNELLRDAGPFVASGQRLSRYPLQGTALRPNSNVKVEILEVSDIHNNLDYLTQADFTVSVRIMDASTTMHGKDNTRVATGFKPVYGSNLPTTVIPIRIAVSERDTPDPHDHCTISRVKGRDNAYLYFDTRTQRITGDYTGNAGDTIWMDGLIGATNRARVKVRITGS